MGGEKDGLRELKEDNYISQKGWDKIKGSEGDMAGKIIVCLHHN